MRLQEQISRNLLENKKSKTNLVLIENISYDNKYYIGRTIENAPDIDGIVYIKNELKNQNMLNKFVECDIIDISDYDLIAKFK